MSSATGRYTNSPSGYNSGVNRKSPVPDPVMWADVSDERHADLATIGYTQESWDYEQLHKNDKPIVKSPARLKTPPRVRAPPPPPPPAPSGPDWTSGLPSLKDPSVLFLLGCLLAPILLALLAGTLTGSALFEYLVHPIPIVAGVLLFLYLYGVHQGLTTVPEADKLIAAWYLVNGFGFKSIMDTFAGSLQGWSLMTVQYNLLEARYLLPLGSQNAEGLESTPVHLTSLLEIIVMVPLCLIAYALIVRQPSSGYRYAVELATSTLQIAGVWYFYLPLILPTVSDSVTKLLMSDSRVDVYFRGVFGCIICPLIWVVVPSLRIYDVSNILQTRCSKMD